VPLGSQRKDLERISQKGTLDVDARKLHRQLGYPQRAIFVQATSIFACPKELFNHFPLLLSLFLLIFWAASDASRSLADQPDQSVNSEQVFKQASEAALRHDSHAAVKLADRVIQRDADFALAYYLRGRERFRLGQIEDSVADFNRYIELRPEAAAAQWERGISLYYAGQYREGARQFAAYQTRYDNDVENSVWRFLCVARTEGIEKARNEMLPIENDPRVPMMEIYRMYRGQSTPDRVLQAAAAGQPAADVLAGRLFYAHLYIGLLYEAESQAELVRKHIQLAGDAKNKEAPVNRYMWDVARIHAQRLQAAASKDQPPR